jgi:uncharacterized membrane protein
MATSAPHDGNSGLLGIHHVNETVAPAQWIWWGLGFLIWGIAF